MNYLQRGSRPNKVVDGGVHIGKHIIVSCPRCQKALFGENINLTFTDIYCFYCGWRYYLNGVVVSSQRFTIHMVLKEIPPPELRRQYIKRDNQLLEYMRSDEFRSKVTAEDRQRLTVTRW